MVQNIVPSVYFSSQVSDTTQFYGEVVHWQQTQQQSCMATHNPHLARAFQLLVFCSQAVAELHQPLILISQHVHLQLSHITQYTSPC
jgi:hypothetical protein